MEDRDVLRSTIVAVLKYHKVLLADLDGNITVYLPPDGAPQVILLPDEYVSYKLLQGFQWKYGIPIHQFYHPDVIGL